MIGSSSTQLLRNLSFAFKFRAGDEVVISLIDHETNIEPWMDMAERLEMTVKWWKPTSGQNPKLQAKDLESLLSERTRLVACTHSSNLLGTIHDIKSIAEAVHRVPGALLCVDGVAYAPHRPIDVRYIDVDFYVFSWYKVNCMLVRQYSRVYLLQVYGPHMSMLYGHRESQRDIRSLGHYFNPNATLADKLALAGSSYELLHGIPAIARYFAPDPKKTWHNIAAHEERLARVLLNYLTSREDITVYGETSPDSSLRVPTISFTVKGRSSRSVVEEAERTSNLGFRWGHFFSYRLVTEVLALTDDGVVRVSMVHYNTGAYLIFCL